MDESHPFYKYYLSIYGERWNALLLAMIRDEFKVIRLNENSEDFKKGILKVRFSPFQNFSNLENCYLLPSEDVRPFALPGRTADGLLDCYIMDPASIFAARSLEVESNHRVLDMCAAPGGKTLIFAEALMGTGELVANELSESRRGRLQSVLRQYIPAHLRENIWVKGKDGIKYGLVEAEGYDRILLDAPCSGEKHVLESPSSLREWSVARGKNLAVRQYSLLASAWAALKNNGKLVYSTCSINPIENDEIIRKLIKKKKKAVQILRTRWGLLGEETEFGVQFFPDKCHFGPMYFSVLLKTEESSFNEFNNN